MTARPCILCIGGHDPTGGAGIQADIETVNALGARAVALVSCLTAQDTSNVVALLATPEDAFRRQRDVLLADIEPDAVKIGVLGSPQLVAAVAEWLAGFAGPVVVDPVVAAGGGTRLSTTELMGQICDRILPRAALVTPNRAELRQLAGTDDEETGAAQLLRRGTGGVLVTGADEATTDQVTNLLYRRGAAPTAWFWPRLPNTYHGSGCTLASACATRLAFGDDFEAAAATAQAFTWESLASAEAVGAGQLLPRRCQ